MNSTSYCLTEKDAQLEGSVPLEKEKKTRRYTVCYTTYYKFSSSSKESHWIRLQRPCTQHFFTTHSSADELFPLQYSVWTGFRCWFACSHWHTYSYGGSFTSCSLPLENGLLGWTSDWMEGRKLPGHTWHASFEDACSKRRREKLKNTFWVFWFREKYANGFRKNIASWHKESNEWPSRHTKSEFGLSMPHCFPMCSICEKKYTHCRMDDHCAEAVYQTFKEVMCWLFWGIFREYGILYPLLRGCIRSSASFCWMRSR